ncbi:methyltransferase domain-containing protein [bacterium]|nr:methyltransferase domain-containing protein [candidate division CSSED10-310 bacterium]
MATTLTRREKILFAIDTDGAGLEIGPSYQPILPKSEGYRIQTLDTCSQAELIAKFANDPIDPSRIEPVDYIWQGESLTQTVGQCHCFDFIIASHVIEHTPDLIRFFQDIDNLLTPNGVLSLVIPDKRYCFDHFRPLTGLARVVDAYENRAHIHSPGTAAEHFIYYVTADGRHGWNSDARPHLCLNHSIEDTRQLIRQIRDTGKYFDLHAWCFTPASFAFLVSSLTELDFIRLHILSSFPTTGFEFFVSMSRTPPPIQHDRIAMMTAMHREERDLSGLLRRTLRRFLPWKRR